MSLWCIYIPGPDECHAAPSEAAAHHMAARHNAAMVAYFAKHPDPEVTGLSLESCTASVRPWPWSAESHAEDMSGFDPRVWGLGGGAA